MKCDKHTMLLYAVTDRAWVGEQTLYQQVESALKGEYADMVRKYFMKGYAFCLQHPEQWELIGVSKVDALPLANSRKIEITGCDLDGNKAGNGWESSSAAYLRYQMNTMVNGILDTWFKTGKYPY